MTRMIIVSVNIGVIVVILVDMAVLATLVAHNTNTPTNHK